MSKEIPTPYVWTFQPQMGAVAGASQDYSTRMHWLSAGPRMIDAVNNIRDTQNRILMTQNALTATPRNLIDPRVWPPHLLRQPSVKPTTLEFPRNEILEKHLTSSGMQLGGGGWEPPDIYAAGLQGSGIQLNELPTSGLSASTLRPDGLFQLGGGGRSSFNPLQTDIAFQALPSQPRHGGLGSRQFIREFAPTVYLNPFSGPPDSYPDQFISNYNIQSHSVNGYS